MTKLQKFAVVALAFIFSGTFFYWKKTPKNTSVSGYENFDRTNSNSIIAIVGDAEIKASQLDWEIKIHSMTPSLLGETKDQNITQNRGSDQQPESIDTNSPMLRQRLLVTIIERSLLFQWIQKYSEGFDFNDSNRYLNCIQEHQSLVQEVKIFSESPAAKESLKNKLCQESLIRQYLTEKIYAHAKVSEIDMQAYYNSNIEKFRQPQTVQFKQILFAKEEDAKHVRPLVSKSNFSDFAKRHSIAPESAQGGLLGPFRRDQLPSFFDIVFNMQIDEISDIIRSDYGFHILLLVQKMPAEVLSYSKVKNTIRANLLEEEKSTLYQNWLTSAMNSIKVSTNQNGDNRYGN